MRGDVAGPMSVFEADNVWFAYRDTPALKGLSLEVRQGERVTLIGANGSGKSTLLRLLAGLAFAERGQVRFFGEALTEERLEPDAFFFRFRRGVGVLFQNPDLQLFNASVFDEVAFGPLQLGMPREQIRAIVEETLESMGIADLRHRAPHRLSGGEKKRVALASVLALNPDVLLLDEPTAALDPKSETQIIELLASWADGRKTVVTATHDLQMLEDIADRCYVLQDGQVAGEGTPLAILHDLRLLTAARLIRPQHHGHETGSMHSHPHVHSKDL
jgi:cobalt/nickel transport system ATP-binding protein